MFSRARQALDHASAARFFPQPLERQAGPRRRTATAFASPRSSASSTIALSAKRAPEAQKPLQLPAFLQLVDPPQGGDNLLAYRRPLTPTFDNLQIGAAWRGLPAEIHGGEPRDDSIVVRTPSPHTQPKSIEKCTARGTTLSQSPPIPINNINDLDAAAPRNCKRSVWQEDQLSADRANGLANGFALVAAEVVHDHQIARPQCWTKFHTDR